METLEVIRTIDGLNALLTYLEGKEFIAFDTETTGLTKDDEIIGYSVAAEVDKAFYVINSEWKDGKLQYTEVADSAEIFMYALQGKSLIMHNAVFDCNMVRARYGIDLMPYVHTDTLILAHLLDENRHCGLKELGIAIYGEDVAQEQKEMKASIVANGGQMTKACYELYKADADLIAKYGAKDAILTLKLFYEFVPKLYEEGLDKFFYEDESMPLLRGPTYDLNTTGLRIDPDKLTVLRQQLEADCLEALSFINKEIYPYVKEQYPGTSKKNTFNIGSTQQLSWLLFGQYGREFSTLTDEGKVVCKFLCGKLPYTLSAKRDFIQACLDNAGRAYAPGAVNKKTGKTSKPKTIAAPWKYLKADKATLAKYADKYKWVAKFLEYNKNKKLLSTYVDGIGEKMRYNIIRPGFKQHGTTSGRYSSQSPNFQNLPREDKRVKACIVSRPGKVFVGADQSQLEPRCFASVSQDPTLMNCFESGDDFYSVIGAPIFNKTDCELVKDHPNSFAKKYPKLRDMAKVIALATPYGRLANHQAQALGCSEEEAQQMLDDYFDRYPNVKKMMLDSHEQAKTEGRVYNIFGRPRRIPNAMNIPRIYGKNTRHKDLPYEARGLLNLAMNHRVQSTAASIMNRAAIAVWKELQQFKGAHIVLQVHDELVLECLEQDATKVAEILQRCMEESVVLPGVKLEAKPVIAKSLADLK